MGLKLLCMADIHLGRRPGHLPDALLAREINVASLTPTAAWRTAIDEALLRKVDAVLLAGDVVQDDNRFFEAYGPLEAGVKRLVAADVPVFAIAGNHDTEVLPRLAKQIDGFTLLGAGGVWETATLTGADGTQVQLAGWSFPKRHTNTSPLATHNRSNNELPSIGLLHCDLDAASSKYAPVWRNALESSGINHWLLGHIHKPSLGGDQLSGYLGSLVGLTPGEHGPRGPWLIEVSQNGSAIAEQLPLAPLRWERWDIDVTDLTEPDQLQDELLAAMQRLDDQEEESLSAAKAVGCRFRLVGRSPIRRELLAWIKGQDINQLCRNIEGRAYFIERVEDRIQPAFDLETLAMATDPPGLMAARLLALTHFDEEGRELVRRAAPALKQAVALAAFDSIEDADYQDEAIRQLLISSGMDALDELLAQKEAQS